MKFQISRTSHGFSQHEPPCLHATLKDETPGSDRVGADDEYQHVWTVEVETIADLLGLAQGPVNRRIDRTPKVIVGPARDGCLPTIEIYDAYRE